MLLELLQLLSLITSKSNFDTRIKEATESIATGNDITITLDLGKTINKNKKNSRILFRFFKSKNYLLMMDFRSI